MALHKLYKKDIVQYHVEVSGRNWINYDSRDRKVGKYFYKIQKNENIWILSYILLEFIY